MRLRRGDVLASCVATVALAAAVTGCGHASTVSPSASASMLVATAYPADLAAAVRTRGFDLAPATGQHVPVTVGAAVTASKDFRPPGTAVAAHLALVTTPGFTSLDFAAPKRGKLFDRTPTWLVVYHGEEAGQAGTWVVFVNAATGEAQSMVGFGANLQGGAPCPNNRCIFE